MFSNLRFKSSSLIGIDINTEEIRLIGLIKTKNGNYLERCAVGALPPGTIIDGKIKDLPTVKTVMNDLVVLTKSKGLCAAVALPMQSVISRRIKLPSGLVEEEYEKQIVNSLNQYFPGMAEELCFDYTKLNQDELFLVAARQDYVQDYLNLMNQVGLKVKIIDVDLFALTRAIPLFLSSQQIISILDFYSTSAHFMVIQNQEIIFSQLILTCHFSVDFNSALQNYFSMHRQIKLNVIILSGNISIDSDISQIIQQEFNLQSVRANPFSKMNLSPELEEQKVQQIAPHMLVSCGLAMREMPQW